MKTSNFPDVYVTQPVPVGHHKCLIPDIIPDPSDTPSRQGFITGINNGNLPGFRRIIMYPHGIVIDKIKRDIGMVQVVIRKIFLDNMLSVSRTYNKFIKSIKGIFLHDVPEHRLPVYLYHGFWFFHALLTDSCA